MSRTARVDLLLIVAGPSGAIVDELAPAESEVSHA